MGGTSPGKRQKSLLFRLDKTVSLDCLWKATNKKMQDVLKVPKSSMVTITLKWKFITTWTLFRVSDV